jgi:hypothetical protein
LAGLRGDATRGVQQLGQVVDGAGQPAATPPGTRITLPALLLLRGFRAGSTQRSLGVGQQPIGVSRRLLGRVGEFAGYPAHRGLGLVPARRGPQPQFRADVVGPLTRRTGPVAHLGPRRATGGLDAPPCRRDPADRLAQQPGVGRIQHASIRGRQQQTHGSSTDRMLA